MAGQPGKTVAPDAGELLRGIAKIGDRACRLALKHYRRVSHTLKADRSFVTAADIEIEKLLNRELPKLLPGSMIVGEETAPDEDFLARVRKAEWVWVIDPVDGTGSFVDQLPFFCVSIGLARRGRPYAGVVRFPVSGDRFEAVRGFGAFYNGASIKLRRNMNVDGNLAFYTYSRAHWWSAVTYAGKLRNVGTTAGHLCTLARGAGFGVLAHGAVWDYMGAAAVLLEAGGTLKYLNGDPIDWPEIITRRTKLKLPVVASLPGRWPETVAMVRTLRDPYVPANID